MQLKSLIPSRQRSDVARPETVLFGPLHRQIDRLFDDFTRGLGPLAAAPGAHLIPRIDVAETGQAIEISVELPGLQRGDVEIALDDNVLTIRGVTPLNSLSRQSSKDWRNGNTPSPNLSE